MLFQESDRAGVVRRDAEIEEVWLILFLLGMHCRVNRRLQVLRLTGRREVTSAVQFLSSMSSG
jgi:hypothetical protein